MTNNISPPASIGFIGLGNMGYPMATRLANAGYKLTVSDLNTSAVTKFCEETGSTAAKSLQELGEVSDVVITMLPEGKVVRKVLLDEAGVAGGLQPGTILIDMSTCSPVDTRNLGEELSEAGFHLIDAPVSGGVVKAIDGSLAIMAGGESEVIERCIPLLENMGKVFKTGGPASGHAMKCMNNFLSAGSLAIASEAVILGTRFGLDPKIMVDILNSSTGKSNSTEHKFPAFILPGTFNSGFYIGLMAKDLRLAVDLAESEDASAELLHHISQLWDNAESELGFKADNTEIFSYLETHATKTE